MKKNDTMNYFKEKIIPLFLLKTPLNLNTVEFK